MIPGYFRPIPGGRRPFVVGQLTIGRVTRDIHFMVDTGADVTMLSPVDAELIELDIRSLPRQPMAGVGGEVRTARVAAEILLGSRRSAIELHVIVSSRPERDAAIRAIPSLLGRDVLSNFALYYEDGRDLLLLLEPHEAARLPFP